MTECKNKQCVKHTQTGHNSGCKMSGTNKCEDVLHIRTCQTQSDLDLLGNILNNYTDA